MSRIDPPARGCGRVSDGYGAPVTQRLKRGLMLGAAGAALLTGAGAATAQDRTNVAPFSNSGAYTGNVLSNTSNISNNGPGGSWTGNVVTNLGIVTNTGAGAVWTGSVSNDNNVNNQDGARWVGNITWNNNALLNGDGSTWEGDVLSNGGNNSLTQIENRGTWTGAVRGNTTRIFNENIWAGDVTGNTGNIYNNYAGSNTAVWTGDVVSNSFLILNFAGGTWNGNVIDNPGDIANYGAWNGNLTNRGRIIHTGVWTGNVVNTGTFFRAENQIIGAFDNRGAIQLTGNLSGITTLTNSGRLQLTQNSGVQTLSVGNLVLASTSSYEIDVTTLGTTDKIVVSGNAALGGTVTVVAAGGTYPSPSTYTILSASSISGQFAGVTTNLAFLAAKLTYSINNVFLTMQRNDVGFAATGATGNQAGVGAAVEALRTGNPLYNAVLWLTPAQARNAFDLLSGEAHASADNMALNQASLIGNVALDRLRQTSRDPGQGAAAMSFASETAAPAEPASSKALWTSFYGSINSVSAANGTSSVTGSSGGVAVGVDGLQGNWRLGVMAHGGTSSSRVNALGSTLRSDDYGLGVYGGREWGDTALALGAVYTRHDIQATRNVAFSGFSDSLAARYTAGTVQTFAELSHTFRLEAVTLRPFTGLAYVSRTTSAFTETGGAAALTSQRHTVSAASTALGMQAERQLLVGDGKLLTASGSLGWRRSFADTPGATYAFASGNSFNVVGAPIARDMLAVNGSLRLNVTNTATVDLGYDGLLGAGASTHALKATWTRLF